jgi:hypothetical protein
MGPAVGANIHQSGLNCVGLRTQVETRLRPSEFLGVLRWLEWRLPRHSFARLRLRFAKDKVMSEDDVRHLLARWGFELHQVDYHMSDRGVHPAPFYGLSPNLADRRRVVLLGPESFRPTGAGCPGRRMGLDQLDRLKIPTAYPPSEAATTWSTITLLH